MRTNIITLGAGMIGSALLLAGCVVPAPGPIYRPVPIYGPGYYGPGPGYYGPGYYDPGPGLGATVIIGGGGPGGPGRGGPGGPGRGGPGGPGRGGPGRAGVARGAPGRGGPAAAGAARAAPATGSRGLPPGG